MQDNYAVQVNIMLLAAVVISGENPEVLFQNLRDGCLTHKRMQFRNHLLQHILVVTCQAMGKPETEITLIGPPLHCWWKNPLHSPAKNISAPALLHLLCVRQGQAELNKSPVIKRRPGADCIFGGQRVDHLHYRRLQGRGQVIQVKLPRRDKRDETR